MIDSVMLVLGVQQNDSVIYTYISIPLQIRCVFAGRPSHDSDSKHVPRHRDAELPSDWSVRLPVIPHFGPEMEMPSSFRC